MNLVLKKKTKQYEVLGGITIILLYIFPYIIYGENSYITIHDFLDSSIAHIKAVIDNNAIFDGSKTIPILSGLPRSLFFSICDIKIIPFLFLPSYWAIIVNLFLVKVTAFIGLYLLLDKHVLDNGKYKNLINLTISVCFALIPFYVDYGISSAGIPLVIYSFLNLYKRMNVWKSYFIILYFGFYSSLILSGLFLCIVLFIYFLYVCRQEKFPCHYFIGLCLLSLIYIGININLFISFFISDNFISHRTEFYSETTFKNAISNTWAIVCNSQYHAGSFFSLPIIVIFLYVWFKYRTKDKRLNFYLTCLISIIGAIFFAYILKWLFPTIQLFRSFQFDRFYFLYPGFCFMLLAACMQKLLVYSKHLIGAILILVIFFTTIIRDTEFVCFVKSVVLKKKIQTEQPSYQKFYDTNLFNMIEKSISTSSRTDYRIACLGIFPSILEYNGFYTIDSYFFNYPLSYKHCFREIIEKELDKSIELKNYFDNWGSRCYLFSSELGLDYMWGKERSGKVTNLEINPKKLKEMDCSYIFSAVEIENYKNLNLHLEGEYSTPTSYWKIYVYRI